MISKINKGPSALALQMIKRGQFYDSWNSPSASIRFTHLRVLKAYSIGHLPLRRRWVQPSWQQGLRKANSKSLPTALTVTLPEEIATSASRNQTKI